MKSLVTLTLAVIVTLIAPVSLSAQVLSGTWHFGATSTSHIVTGGVSAGGFTLGSDASSSNVTATNYFATGSAPISLAVGQALSLSFDVTFDFKANSADAFRFGLFNTGNSQTTGNNYTVAGNEGWLGYSLWVPAGGSALGLYDRTAANTVVMASGANASLASESGSSTNSTYENVNLTILRTSATQVSVSASFNDVEFTNVVDSTDAVFSFDAVHFFGRGSALVNGTNKGSFTIGDLSVQVIPEPSATALLAGLGVLGWVASGRRCLR